jgi:hypothetical protein
MKKILITFSVLLLSITILAQQNNSVVTEIDYFNALRYTGARNIARTTDGYVVVAYEPGVNYTNQEIWYAYFNSSFGTWDVSQLSHSATNATGVPALVADESGHIHASWKEKRSNDSGERSLMYSKLTFNDEFTYTWSTPVRADTFTFNNPGVNTIQLDDSENPFILFSIWDGGDIYNANIYAAKNIGGSWSTDNLTIEFPTPGVLPLNYMDVNLASGKNGEMFAAWEDKPVEVVSQWEVLFSHYIPNTGWSKPEIVSPIFDGVGIQKYVDGYTPTTNATALYNMGPSDYALAGNTTVIYNETSTSKSVISSFNPFYMMPEETQQQYIKDAINFFGVTSSDSILLVDDDNAYNNETVVQKAIESLGIPYRTFDCGNSSGMATAIPSFADDLSGKKLVIWFTGDDYKNLAFWNIADSDNEELKNYLNQAGAQLFVMGRSWMYDRYGKAPDTLKAGDFAYDYLGIQSYNVQAWSDDGSQGVTQLDRVVDDNFGFSSIKKIEWKNNGTRQGVPSIASDPSGKVHMVYQDDRDNSIKYLIYNNGNWSTPLRIDMSDDTVSVTRPNIAVDPNYGVYVIWRQETKEVDVDGKSKKIYNVFYRTSPDGGLTWNNPVQLSNTDYINDKFYSTYRATIGYKVRKAIEGRFTGGADVVWVQASDKAKTGYYIMYGNIPYVGTITDVNEQNALPDKFELTQNYPNPFNPSTTFAFSLPQKEFVTLTVYNSLGEKVADIVAEEMEAGNYKFNWNAQNLTSGVYFARLTAGVNVQTRKIMLLK